MNPKDTSTQHSSMLRNNTSAHINADQPQNDCKLNGMQYHHPARSEICHTYSLTLFKNKMHKTNKFGEKDLVSPIYKIIHTPRNTISARPNESSDNHYPHLMIPKMRSILIIVTIFIPIIKRNFFLSHLKRLTNPLLLITQK